MVIFMRIMGIVVLVLMWILTVVAAWIGLACILVMFSIVRVDWDGFIRVLSHFIVIGPALIIGTIVTARAYFRARKSHMLYESS